MQINYTQLSQLEGALRLARSTVTNFNARSIEGKHVLAELDDALNTLASIQPDAPVKPQPPHIRHQNAA